MENNYIALIPARAGSKGLPNKNMRILAKKPLINHTLESALACKKITKSIVSSDGMDILEHSSKLGAVPLNRPKEIANDNTDMAAVIEHAIHSAEIGENEYIVLLQPTSPLRTLKHLYDSIEEMEAQKAKAIISVLETSSHTPYKALKLDDNGLLNGLVSNEAPFARRQDCPRCFYANGAIYIFQVADFLELGRIPVEKSLPFIMDSRSSLDIDDINDLNLAEKELCPHE